MPPDDPAQFLASLTSLTPLRTDDTSIGHALADLIGEDQPTQLYLHLLSHGTCDADGLERAGFTGATLQVALRVLLSRNMIEADAGGWRITPPQQALPALATQLESRAIDIRAALPGLVAAHRHAASSTETSRLFGDAEVLDGEREVAFAFAQCIARAREEARAMRAHSLTTRESTLDALPGSRDGRVGALGHLISVRTVIDSSLVTDFTAEDFAQLQPSPNVRVTLAPGVPFTAAINDGGMAVVETVTGGRIAGLIIRDPGLVAAVSATIDLLLRLAAPLPTAGATPASARTTRQGTPPPNAGRAATASAPTPAEDGLGEQERLILTLLAAGVPDAAVARRVGVSHRTFDRRVRGLMNRLNAETRFQAGVLAARRGWL